MTGHPTTGPRTTLLVKLCAQAYQSNLVVEIGSQWGNFSPGGPDLKVPQAREPLVTVTIKGTATITVRRRLHFLFLRERWRNARHLAAHAYSRMCAVAASLLL